MGKSRKWGIYWKYFFLSLLYVKSAFQGHHLLERRALDAPMKPALALLGIGTAIPFDAQTLMPLRTLLDVKFSYIASFNDMKQTLTCKSTTPYTCTHACMHACIHTYRHTHIHTYKHTYIHTICIYIYIYIFHTETNVDVTYRGGKDALKIPQAPGNVRKF
jgi:hypothetical protein